MDILSILGIASGAVLLLTALLFPVLPKENPTLRKAAGYLFVAGLAVYPVCLVVLAVGKLTQ